MNTNFLFMELLYYYLKLNHNCADIQYNSTATSFNHCQKFNALFSGISNCFLVLLFLGFNPSTLYTFLIMEYPYLTLSACVLTFAMNSKTGLAVPGQGWEGAKEVQ